MRIVHLAALQFLSLTLTTRLTRFLSFLSADPKLQHIFWIVEWKWSKIPTCWAGRGGEAQPTRGLRTSFGCLSSVHPQDWNLLKHLSLAASAHSTCPGLGKGAIETNLYWRLNVILPRASSNEVILWLGEKPWRAPISEAFPPDSAPSGRAPVGVRPFSCRTCSDSSLIGHIRGAVTRHDPTILSPEHREYSGHFPDGSNFVPNYFFSDLSLTYGEDNKWEKIFLWTRYN